MIYLVWLIRAIMSNNRNNMETPFMKRAKNEVLIPLGLLVMLAISLYIANGR
jgi:hypothetical protein